MNKNNKQKVTRDSDGARFAKLALMGEQVFHAGDLAAIWNIRNKNTLRVTLSRYAKRGLLLRTYKGLYSLKKITEIDPYVLGVRALHCPAYITGESVLYEQGIINQKPQMIALASPVSKKFVVGPNRYHSRQMRDEYLFNDSGLVLRNGVRQATTARAIADMLYYNPKKYFDSHASKLINWAEVKRMMKAVGYQD